MKNKKSRICCTCGHHENLHEERGEIVNGQLDFEITCTKCDKMALPPCFIALHDLPIPKAHQIHEIFCKMLERQAVQPEPEEGTD